MLRRAAAHAVHAARAARVAVGTAAHGREPEAAATPSGTRLCGRARPRATAAATAAAAAADSSGAAARVTELEASRPEEPGPEDCCNSGCELCTWTQHFEAVSAWERELDAAREALAAEEQGALYEDVKECGTKLEAGPTPQGRTSG